MGIKSAVTIFPELTPYTDIKGILEVVNLILIQVGDDGLFLQGHVGQDILDDLIYVVGIEHNFTAGRKFSCSIETVHVLGHPNQVFKPFQMY